MKLRRFYKQKHPKYKTEAERIAAIKAAKKRHFERNKDAIREYNRNYNRERYHKMKEKEGIATRRYKTTQYLHIHATKND